MKIITVFLLMASAAAFAADAEADSFVELICSGATEWTISGESLMAYHEKITKEVVFADEKIVSYRIEKTCYTGGAHDHREIVTASIDRATGKKLKLSDIAPGKRLAELDRRLKEAFVRYKKVKDYAERLDGHEWSEILANTDPDGVWKDYCDFSKFDHSDWLNLLSVNPEYADRCPFEKLEQSEIDSLLREQPELAGKCGITDAVGLYLVNDAPYEDEDPDIPFYPSLPADAPRKELTAWLKNSFPEMTEHEVSRWVHTICFNRESRLGTYSRSVAVKKAEKLTEDIKNLKTFHLKVKKI